MGITEISRLLQSRLIQSVLESCADLDGIKSKETSSGQKWPPTAKAGQHIRMPPSLSDNVFLELA